MFDSAARTIVGPVTEHVARRLRAAGVRSGVLTGAGLVVGVAACVAAATGSWILALELWLGNRLLDGLDGPVARLEGETDLGGLLDFLADFVVYGGFVVGTAIAVPDARVAATALLAAYLLNNVALLGYASLAEKARHERVDERTLRLTPGLTEGTETILAYCAICLLPGHAATVAWVFTGLVLVTVLQRVRQAVEVFGGPA